MTARHRGPEVTVVIPTRDRWPLLERALASVLAQRTVDLEAIVVNDGSASTMPQRLVTPRVRVIEVRSSEGVARARNRGLAAARGSWVAWLDDDDLWAPGKLRRQLDAANANVALVYVGAILIDEEARMIGARRPPLPAELDPGILERNLVGSPSGVMARTELLRRLGGFDESLGVLADWDLWIRLLEGRRAEACPEPLFGYTIHRGNMHLSDPARIRREVRILRRKHATRCEAAGVTLAGRGFSEWLVNRYRDAGMRGRAASLYLKLGLRHRDPRHLVRAPLMLVGEGALRVARRGRPRSAGEVWIEPEWLVDLRKG